MPDDSFSAIKKKLQSGTPLSLQEIRWLMDRIDELEKKNDALQRHVLELTQEMENIKADFDQDMR
jgi:molecular chaperone GrpE (heat shock protein)